MPIPVCNVQVQASYRGFQARKRVAQMKKEGKEVPPDLEALAAEEAAAIKVRPTDDVC